MPDTTKGKRTPLTIARERLRDVTIHDFFNMRMLGFALMRAWVYLMFLGAATSVINWNGESVPALVFIASTITLCITLFASALLHRKFEGLIKLRVVRVLVPILTSLGTLCIAFIGFPGTPWILLAVVGAILTGVGSGLIDLGYGEQYRNTVPLKTVLEVPLAFALAATLFPLISSLPSLVACFACTLLPLISGWILFFKLNTWAKETSTVEPFEIHLGKFSWRIGLCACLIGLADAIVRAVFMTTSDATIESFYQFPLMWASFITLIIVYGCVLLSSKMALRSVYKTVMFIMALFFMLLPVLTGMPLLENIIALAGYGTFNVMIWLILAEISYNYRLSSIMVFGIGWGMITLGVLLGSIVGQFICTFAPFTPQTLSLIALLATLAILISYMFVFKESDLIELTKPEIESEVENEDKNEGTPKKLRFQDRCIQVAQDHKLSPKETEIMILFAKGRSSARIQEELYLSKGTVSTHLRHIYQKTEVHTKQELLDLIEGRF